MIIALAILLSTVPPLSADLYLPGLPLLTTDLGTESSVASQTLTVFFFFLAVGTLFTGTISDKTGRRPMLLVCSLIASIACIGCAFAQSVEVLLVLRSIQGLAGGGMVAGGMVIVKDCFEGDRMAKIFALTQAVSMIAPVVAPLLGVAVLAIGGWRGSFIAIGALMAIGFLLVIPMKETLPPDQRASGSILGPIKESASLFRMGSFVLPLIVGSLFNSPFMSYVGNASYIYEDVFGLSTTVFGVIFAVTSVASVAGPLLYMRMEATLNMRRAMTVFIVLLGILAIPLVAFGRSGPWVFMACMVGISFISAYIRPMIASFLLAPLTSAAGSASSVISFVSTSFGCAGVFVGTAGFGLFEGVQAVTVISVALMVILWVIYRVRYKAA